MPMRLAESITDYNQTPGAVRTPYDWVDRMTVIPGDVRSEEFGGLFWHTNHSVACAATLDGLGRLLSLAHHETRDTIEQLATRPVYDRTFSDFQADNTKGIIFDRYTPTEGYEGRVHYLADVISMLPQGQTGEFSARGLLEIVQASSAR